VPTSREKKSGIGNSDTDCRIFINLEKTERVAR
jgi:hypothetical protein